MDPSGVSLLTAIIAALASYGVGYGHAVMTRANKDYKTTKGAVPKMRKSFWVSFGQFVKASAVATVLLAVLVVWVVRDVNQPSGATPVVPAGASPSASPARR